MYSIAQEKRDEGYMMRQRVLPIPWNDDKTKLGGKMKIGYFIEEGSVKVDPSSSVVSLSEFSLNRNIGKVKGKGLMGRQVQHVEEQYKSASTNYERQDMKSNYLNHPHVRRPCRVTLINSHRDLQGISRQRHT